MGFGEPASRERKMNSNQIKPNTLYFGDNLAWMEQWADESIDLVYLDPPFNSNADYNMIFGSGAQVRAYDDTWSWGDTAVQDLDKALILDNKLATAIQGIKTMLPKTPMLAYLCHLAPRLYHMHRLLKNTGSLYLHCDDTSGHYIKILLDAIFQPFNYRNTIIWRRATAHNDARRFGRITDYILFYSKSNDYIWNGQAIATQKNLAEIKKSYPSQDKHGRYRADNITGPLHSAQAGTPSTQPWRGYDVFAMGRCWSVPKIGKGQYADYIKDNFIPHYDQIKGIHERLDALDEAGLIHHPKNGKWPGLKRYAQADTKKPAQNLILSPTGFTNYSKGKDKEYLGYDTQKPEALLRQFIKVSSNPGDVVLDPYCGCGTTIRVCRDVEGNGSSNNRRQFIGIDITHIAIAIIEDGYKARFGETLTIKGAPHDMASARDLFKRNPFQFEAWAVAKITGLTPNKKQTGDRGVDGKGYVITNQPDEERKTVLAQIKGGSNIKPADIRDFIGAINSEKATFGVFVVMKNALITKQIRSAAAQENIEVEGRNYPKIQIFSVEDYFNGQRPNLPPLLNRFTGKPSDWIDEIS